MVLLEPDGECFIRFRGRLFRGVATGFPMARDEIQVRSDCASHVVKRWRCLSFSLRSGRGLFARDAELLVPQTMGEWSKLGEEYEREARKPVSLKAVVPAALCNPQAMLHFDAKTWEAPVYRAPYADNDDDSRVMTAPFLPEGYEPGE